jgi:hypothetical protein
VPPGTARGSSSPGERCIECEVSGRLATDLGTVLTCHSDVGSLQAGVTMTRLTTNIALNPGAPSLRFLPYRGCTRRRAVSRPAGALVSLVR